MSMRIGFLLSLMLAVSLTQQPTFGQTSSASQSRKPGTGLSRWLEIETLAIAARYRFIGDSAGVTSANQLQHREDLAARLLFDRDARFTLNLLLGSGSSFTSGWNNTGWGTGEPVTNLYMKQLHLVAKPVSGVQIQYGGIGVLAGAGTEITTYDNDAYLVGQRATFERPQNLFLDEISITYAYLGDLGTPDLNKRFHRLKRSNYHQFLVSKNIGERATISADYSSQWGIGTLREAVRVRIPESRVLSNLRYENYQRLDVDEDFGFAVQADRTLGGRLTVGGGLANIDPNYGGLNSDRFGSGRRLFLVGSFSLTRGFEVSSFYQHSLADDSPMSNRTRFDLIFTYKFF